MKSTSEKLHELLMKEEVGFRFTMQTLNDMAAEAEIDVTRGAVTGFIHRAVHLGRVQMVGKVKGNERRMLYQYEIVDREPWKFKDKSYGSYKGRKIGERHYQEVPDGVPEPEKEPEKETIKVPNYPLQSLLSDRLFNLAVEVSELEKKSLKDYSTDELIAELKTRVK